MRLSGTETISVELAGVLGAPLELQVPYPLALTNEVSILVLTMKGLGIDRRNRAERAWRLHWVPLLPRFDYNEVLYRVGASIDGVPAWLALRCDLDRGAIRQLAKVTIRYPVARAHIAITDGGATVRVRATGDEGVLAASLAIDEARASPPAEQTRRTFVLSRERLFEVPWDEAPAPERRHALVEDADTSTARGLFGAGFALAKEAVVHRGRTHFCGVAKEITRGSG